MGGFFYCYDQLSSSFSLSLSLSLALSLAPCLSFPSGREKTELKGLFFHHRCPFAMTNSLNCVCYGEEVSFWVCRSVPEIQVNGGGSIVRSDKVEAASIIFLHFIFLR